MSRGIIEAQTLRSEQFQFEARTSDPADAQPGEYWIRVDQTGTNPNVIAQLRRQDTSGVTACPIFAASEESNLGADVVRGPSVVLDSGSVGFVAMTTGGGAVGSPRAVNSAGAQYVSHNALELFTIPDSEIDRFEWGGPVSDRYSGTTSEFSISTDSPVYDGSYSLKASSNLNTAYIISDNTGLANYPTRGDSVRFYLQFTETGNEIAGAVLFASDATANNGYEINLDTVGKNNQFNLLESPIGTQLAGADIGGISTSQWYRIDVYSTTDKIQAEVALAGNDSPEATLGPITNTTHNGSAFGWRKRNTGEVYDDANLLRNYGLP